MKNIGKIILASGSPRRKEILSQNGIDFEVLTSDKEEIMDSRKTPAEVVSGLSAMKAQDVLEKIEESDKLTQKYGRNLLVIGADTVVAMDDKIFGKPKDYDDAFQMIKSIAGRTHSVFTGVTALIYEEGEVEKVSFVSESKVEVSPMSSQEIEMYINTGESFDKAGGYAIQGRFAPFIREIHGEYGNIVGFPIAEFYRQMKKVGIDILA